ncbi:MULTISPECIES: hypothetical protein [Mycobacterium]|uniref:Uncharacterized protein n=1 Tax=Mycobacterium kiyosense TaxID=2871094 RepID=A0A9P3UUQ3_9MYCO|nr:MULTISPECIES: hypothetical protein [Mycobacterium]BDB43841.1 hypothetical protein IWGMT90018_42870 [Mycobacterium kiyosense]BDE15400.1 hypothetical protein MKCMC460_42600 [Mycobacterium sp. 20KCMC460]GLB82712.1 hypothetical protein SRL2020028_19680 [Mycobacterium kiyosense]GLB90175.1 hypothetical protein SRL2020130_29920 [Mycobacterium kiyosense]GLB95764.1 hypothetical protein SRL2020226_25400 [Mycobacterium kiyosense]
MARLELTDDNGDRIITIDATQLFELIDPLLLEVVLVDVIESHMMKQK